MDKLFLKDASPYLTNCFRSLSSACYGKTGFVRTESTSDRWYQMYR